MSKNFTEDAVYLAFPNASPHTIDIITNWYKNEGAADDFSDVDEFAEYICTDFLDMFWAGDYNDAEFHEVATDMINAGYFEADDFPYEEPELDESVKSLNEAAEGDEYEIIADNGSFVHAKFHATTLANAIKKVAKKLSVYLSEDEIVENKDDLMDDEDPDDFYDGEEALEQLTSTNGDGGDYIISFKNVTQNKELIETGENEVEDWDE